MDARSFPGIRTRSAEEAGVTLGKAVGRHGLRSADRLLAPFGQPQRPPGGPALRCAAGAP